MNNFTFYVLGKGGNSVLKYLKNLLIITIICLAGFSAASATDLIVSSIISPKGTVYVNTPVTISFVVADINVLTAELYDNTVVITKQNSTIPVFMTTVQGRPIQPGDSLIHTATQKWTPTEVGVYSIMVSVNYSQDIDHSNDTLRQDFIVASLPYSIDISRISYNKPFTDYYSTAGLLNFTYIASPFWLYMNVFAMKETDELGTWILQNVLVPSFDATHTISYFFDLSLLGLQDGTLLDSIYVQPIFSFSPLTIPIQIAKDTVPKYPIIDLIYDISDGAMDTTKLPSYDFLPPVVPAAVPIRDTVYRGCTVPNIDLDSSLYNPGSVPGYAGDYNACAPTGAANSMQWLENVNPKISTGLTHFEKLKELSKLMKRENNTGVWFEDFIRGKLAYIDKYKLPIRVNFQGRNSNDDIESDDGIDQKAINKGGGKAPTEKWLKSEMKDSEDVECFIEYHKKDATTDSIRGRHVITLTGVASGGGFSDFWYKDDKDQSHAGGTRETHTTWDTLSNGEGKIETYTSGSSTFYEIVYGAVSESYDSTVVFKEKGTIKKIGGALKRWIFGPPGPTELKADAPKLVNIVAGNGQEQSWSVRNAPLESISSSFFDIFMTDLGHYQSGDSVSTKIIYGDSIWTSKDSIPYPDIFTYLVQAVPFAYNGGSTDNSGFKLSNPLIPSPPITYTGTNVIIKDSILWGLNIPFIDLDSSKFNKVTIPKYAGEMGASAPASGANVFEWLQTQYFKNPSFPTSRKILTDLSRMMNRQQDSGATRDNVIRAYLYYNDSLKLKSSIQFQSLRLGTDDIPSPITVYKHKAVNKSSGVNKSPDWTWLKNALANNQPVIIELGLYDSTGRLYGNWYNVGGILSQNGANKIILMEDIRQDSAGGQFNSMVTWATTADGLAYIDDWSSKGLLCVIESVVSIYYDPAVVFTGVNDNTNTQACYLNIYPNPADQGQCMKITFTNPERCNVSLSVYDILGNKVANIVNGELESGDYNINWDGTNASGAALHAGVYIISLQGQAFHEELRFIKY